MPSRHTQIVPAPADPQPAKTRTVLPTYASVHGSAKAAGIIFVGYSVPAPGAANQNSSG